MESGKMRLDKFLKLSRIIKRRTVAKDASTNGIVSINGKQAKPATQVKIGDIIQIDYPSASYKYRVKDIKENVKKQESEDLYEVIS